MNYYLHKFAPNIKFTRNFYFITHYAPAAAAWDALDFPFNLQTMCARGDSFIVLGYKGAMLYGFNPTIFHGSPQIMPRNAAPPNLSTAKLVK